MSISVKTDTGATKVPITNRKIIFKNGPLISQPDMMQLKVKQTYKIPVHEELSKMAKSVYIVTGLKHESLLSIGKLCNTNL